jgi:hypothetical protein
MMAGDNGNRNGRKQDTSVTEEHEVFIQNHNERMRRVDQALEGLRGLTRKIRRQDRAASSRR